MYNVGDKFEIEIAEVFSGEYELHGDSKLYRINGFNSLVLDDFGLNKLKWAKPYDVEDLEKVKREAYAGGYKCGVETTEKAYQAQAEKEKPKTVKASELAVDTKVICWDEECISKNSRYFAMLYNGYLYARDDCYEPKNKTPLYCWDNMTLEDGTVVLPE